MNSVRKERKEKERNEKIAEANKELYEAIDHGTLSDLIKATKNLGDKCKWNFWWYYLCVQYMDAWMQV